MAPTPRPNKRKRTDPPLPSNDALQLLQNASAGEQPAPDQHAPPVQPEQHGNDATPALTAQDKGKQKEVVVVEEEEQPAQAEPTGPEVNLEEMERIYDMLAEEYHDIVAEMPIEYHRTFLLMRELEDQQIARTEDFKTALQDYLASTLVVQPQPHSGTTDSAPSSAAPSPAASTSTSTTTTDGLNGSRIGVAGRDKMLKVAEMATAAVRAGEDKVGLAITLYEAVDRHIQRLDADLARYEDSLVIGLRDGTLPSHDAPSAIRKSPPGPTTSLGAIALGEKEAYDPAAVGGGGGPAPVGGKTTTGSGAARTTRQKPARTAEEIEKEREWKRRKELVKEERQKKKREEAASGMPVDPNEPVYCYCNRVSFGEMIACENEDCPREWFHLECVGLDKAPEGVWYCDDCVAELKIDPATMQPKR
ncbi:hypothetical protein JCM10908_001804 [Rhodotorula pacifica]|uniref:uncharacterized protein n=1 Tax=Rhodotorula pacifica TaxID=1495444 RepID=UPI003170A30A